jgi:hypothetical protein
VIVPQNNEIRDNPVDFTSKNGKFLKKVLLMAQVGMAGHIFSVNATPN